MKRLHLGLPSSLKRGGVFAGERRMDSLQRHRRERSPRPPCGSTLLFTATEIYPIVVINDYPERFATDTDQIDAMRERAREIWRARWLVVEANVDGDPYLSTDEFSISDIYLAVVSRWAQQEHWRPAYLPKVERLTAAIASRPAIVPVWTRHFGPI